MHLAISLRWRVPWRPTRHPAWGLQELGGGWAPRAGLRSLGDGEAHTWEGAAGPDTCPDSCGVPAPGALGSCSTTGTLGRRCLIRNLI